MSNAAALKQSAKPPKEGPILLSDPMVLAILKGRKTQTRILINPQPPPENPFVVELNSKPGARQAWKWVDRDDESDDLRCWPSPERGLRCPYGPGDRLWVRETWGLRRPLDVTDWCDDPSAELDASDVLRMGSWQLDYRADWGPVDEPAHWRPSIHMPRWASRLTLEVTSVRPEPLHDISVDDIEAEGVRCVSPDKGRTFKYGVDPGPGNVSWSWQAWSDNPRKIYARLWQAVNEVRAPWASNPWIWRVEFRRLP